MIQSRGYEFTSIRDRLIEKRVDTQGRDTSGRYLEDSHEVNDSIGLAFNRCISGQADSTQGSLRWLGGTNCKHRSTRCSLVARRPNS
jgi:hypothetical protein